MSHFFTDPQFTALQALCDTLIPSLEPPPGADPEVAAFYRRAAADQDIARELTKAIRDCATPELQAQTKQFLDLLASPFGTFTLSGSPQKFADLPLTTREKIMLGWSTSPIGLLRQGFQGIKRLTHSLFLSLVNEQGSNPNWPAIQYPGSIEPPNTPTTQLPGPARLPTLTIDSDTTLDCDVVVVGSGAGGGVVAGVLAQAGHRVIVLEKGGYQDESNFTLREYDALRTMYENAGILTSEDLGFVILAGSTLGGGTTVNWAGAFPTPDYVVDEWEHEHHLPGFNGPEFKAALQAVCDRAQVNTDLDSFTPQNQLLQSGCQQLGYHVSVMPRNVKGCDDCGSCCFGCKTGAKQGTLKTWLPDAVKAGAQIVVNCRVEKVLIENGYAVGVAASVGEHATRVNVRARIVVVAAGALHSPALLIRSGIDNPNIGLNLRLHPSTAIRGELTHKAEAWQGVTMAVYSDEFGNLDGQHYGVKLETPPGHPGLIGFATPWLGARTYKDVMLRMSHQAIMFVLCRDRGSGHITVDKSGRPRIHYQLDRIDANHTLKGIEAALRVAVAGGAHEIGTLQSGLPYFRPSGNESDFDNYLAQMRRVGTAPNKLGLFSAHQMGTCRMGSERAKSVLTHTGESWDVRNLYVADASTFPTSSGVNPMITIQAIAYHIAQNIKTRL